MNSRFCFLSRLPFRTGLVRFFFVLFAIILVLTVEPALAWTERDLPSGLNTMGYVIYTLILSPVRKAMNYY